MNLIFNNVLYLYFPKSNKLLLRNIHYQELNQEFTNSVITNHKEKEILCRVFFLFFLYKQHLNNH
jgi:hypothetical protein